MVNIDIYLSIYLYSFICLNMYIFIHTFYISLSTQLYIYLNDLLPEYPTLPTCLGILNMYLSIFLSIYRSISLCILYTYVSINISDTRLSISLYG